MHVFKRIAFVFAAATASGLPGAITLQSQTIAPIWYKALASIFGAIGMGLVGIALGALALIAARNKPDGGVKSAVIIAVLAGLFASWLVFYGMRNTTHSFATPTSDNRQLEEIKEAIGAEIGKARGACEAAKYLKERYCPNFVIEKEMEIACSTNFAGHIPESIEGEINQIFSSERFRGEIHMIQSKTDEGFNIGKAKAIPIKNLCQQYELFVSDTYKKSLEEIVSIGTNFKK